MKRGKVFGGIITRDGRQVRAVVYESSQARAAKVAGCSLYEFQRHWSVTGNDEEVAAAMRHPSKLVHIGRI